MNASLNKNDEIVAQLRAEFVESTLETFDDLEGALFADGVDREETRIAVYRTAHNLKGNALSFGFASVSAIAHRLEDMMGQIEEIDDSAAGDIARYLDAMRSIVSGGRDLGENELPDVLRGLPTGRPSEFEVDAPLEVEILLVTPANAVGSAVARELRECGYRVNRVDSAWQAMQLASCTRPQLVITSAVLEGLGGADLARALKAISTTREVPVAVLTSFDRSHSELQGLPEDMPLIKMGGDVQGELSNALIQLGIV